MPRKTFSEEQMVYALRQAEAGTPVVEVVSEARGDGADLLSVETQVRRAWRSGAAVAAASRGGKPAPQAAGG